MRARFAALLRKIAARLDPDREFVINTVHVAVDSEQLAERVAAALAHHRDRRRPMGLN